MNSLWRPAASDGSLQPASRQAGPAGLVPLQSKAARRENGRFELDFLRDGKRTTVGRQFVSYPFHMTRPFRLDTAIPSLLTVYQQSSSGGLYRGDKLSSRYSAGRLAAAHVTTQAATVVHDCYGEPACQTTSITLAEDSFLALTPDPLVLFPGAACEFAVDARLEAGAVLMLSDAFAMHDPQGLSRPFARLRSDVGVRDGAGRLMVRDCIEVEGNALSGPASPMGHWRLIANILIVGEAARLPDLPALEALRAASGAIFGITQLPNAAGWGLRCLASEAISIRRLCDALFSTIVRAAFGHAPAVRRK